MTSAHGSSSATTCRAAASATAASVPSHAASSPVTPVSRSALHALDRVIGAVLLVPRPNSSPAERAAGERPGADRSAGTTVGYLTDTQFGEFRGHASPVTGRIVFDSQRPARVQVSVSVNPAELRTDHAAGGDHMDDTRPKVRRFPPVTLVTRELRLSPEADGAAGAGILAGTLEYRGVERPVNIPIVLTSDGTLLQGQGRFSLDLTDFGNTPPRLRGFEIGNEITIEVCLLAASQ